jgi:hypothetical protein
MNTTAAKLLVLLVASASFLISVPVNADGFDLKTIRSLTNDDGVGMSDVEGLFGAPFETVEIAKSDNGCTEAWLFSEVIMKGTKVKAIQMLTVYFDEDGYVCGTYITDGDGLNETRNREQ